MIRDGGFDGRRRRVFAGRRLSTRDRSPLQELDATLHGIETSDLNAFSFGGLVRLATGGDGRGFYGGWDIARGISMKQKKACP
jgi:hypothetical protein